MDIFPYYSYLLADFGDEVDIANLHTTPLGKGEFRNNRSSESNNFTQRPKHIFTCIFCIFLIEN